MTHDTGLTVTVIYQFVSESTIVVHVFINTTNNVMMKASANNTLRNNFLYFFEGKRLSIDRAVNSV